MQLSEEGSEEKVLRGNAWDSFEMHKTLIIWIKISLLSCFLSVRATSTLAAEFNLLSSGKSAPKLVISESMKKVPLGQYLGVYIDQTENLDLNAIESMDFDQNFSYFNKDTMTWGFMPKPIWAKLLIHNPFPETREIILESRYAPTDTIQLYTRGNRGAIAPQVAGDHVPAYRRDIHHRYPAFKIKIPPGDLIIYTRTQTSSSANCFFYAWTPAEFGVNQTVEYCLLGAMFGALLVMAGYNLFLYLSFRSSVYLYYVGFICSFIAFQISNQGFASQFVFPNADVNWLSNDGYVVTGELSYFFASLFARDFLNLKEKAPRLAKACLVICVIDCFNLGFLFAFGYGQAIKLTTFNVFFASSVMLGSGIYCAIKKDKPAWIYTSAWMTILFGNAAIGLRASGLIADGFVAEWATIIGGAFEGVLLSLALGYRMNLIRTEYTQRVKALNRQLENQIASVEGIVREKTSDLEKAYDRLKLVDQQKTSFFQNISHELRTPLTMILNTQERLLERSPTDSDLQVAQRNANRLFRLVNQLLDFQKLTTTKMVIKVRPIDLVKFVKKCGDFLGGSNSGRNRTVIITHNGEPINADSNFKAIVIANVDALEKITFNYLSNAIKYGGSSGVIELGIQNQGSSIRLFVRDQGPGISAKDQTKLFQVFSQLDASETREHEGSGLGLALVKELASQMEAKVGVDSAVGHGSTFWLDLTATDDKSSLELTLDTGDDLKLKPWLLDEADDNGERDIQIPVQDIAHRDKGLVLVIDDLKDMRQLVKNLLEDEGYQVVTAGNGEIGLEMIKSYQPNLVIVDWMMPKLSGPDFIKAVRQDTNLSSIPIVLLTAKADEESKHEGVQIGADAFLGKPFDRLELLSTAANLLRLKQSEKKIIELNRHLTENILKRFLPAKIVDEIVDGTLKLEETPEIKSVTIMFSDICGFTKISESLGAWAIAKVLNEYLDAMCKIVFKHGGIVDKFIGDGIMMIFGAPVEVSAEQQIQSAMSCALEMQTKLADLNQNWATSIGHQFKMRIGLHHGPVVVGSFGGKDRSEYTAIGPVVNFASRIESVTSAGAIFFSDIVRDYMNDEDWESAGIFELKGFDGTFTLYRYRESKKKVAA